MSANSAALPQSKNIRRFLDLSTAHISKATNDALGQPGTIDTIYTPTEYGFWIYVPTEIEPDEIQRRRIPDDLERLMRYARARDCDYILLDRDGLEEEGLPVFAW